MEEETTEAESGAATEATDNVATDGAEAGSGAIEAASEAAAQGADAPGMPQLDFATFPNQIFWLIVTLVVTYYILSRIALPRISAILAERSGAINADLATADDLKQKAAEAEQAYEKALADARSEAQRISQETRDAIKADLAEATREADEEIAEKTAGSEARIAEIRASAGESVEQVAVDTAEALVEALGAQADEAAVRDAVKARLSGGAA